LTSLDFYTAWDVIAKHVQGYQDDPILAYRYACLRFLCGHLYFVDIDYNKDGGKLWKRKFVSYFPTHQMSVTTSEFFILGIMNFLKQNIALHIYIFSVNKL